MIIELRSMKVAFANIQNLEEFKSAWKAFAKNFHENPGIAPVEEEPDLLAKKSQDDGFADAFLASVSWNLCQLFSSKQPHWPEQKPCNTDSPWFAGNPPVLRNLYLRKTPAASRVRNLFVPINILSPV